MTFSRSFPATHPRKGEPTHFVEKILKAKGISVQTIFRSLQQLNTTIPIELLESFVRELVIIQDLPPKKHTIRAGKRWKAGDKFSPRVWSGQPYASKMITISNDITISRVVDIEIKGSWVYFSGQQYSHMTLCHALAKNDGLSVGDFCDWFSGKNFSGQIIIWDDKHLPY